MANSLSFGGVDLSAYGLTVRNGPLSLMASTDLALITIPNSDRAVASEPYYQPRTISLDCVVVGSSFADLKSKLDSIAKALGSRELASLALDSMPDRYWMVWRRGEASVTITGSVASLGLEFVAPEPFAFKSGAASTGSMTWPDAGELSLLVGGSARTWPVLEFVAAAPTSAVIVEHSDLDRRIGWTGTLATGSRLRFDCDAWQVWYAPDDGGDWALSMAGVSGEFFYLLGGGEVVNTIRLLAPGSGTLTATWRERYL